MRPSIFKKLILFSLFLILDFQLIAQSQGAPESMNYQAVIRDGSGNIVVSHVGIRIDILLSVLVEQVFIKKLLRQQLMLWFYRYSNRTGTAVAELSVPLIGELTYIL